MDSIRDKADSTTDKAKGEGKEAFGKATGDKQTQGEGKMDQAKGEGKEGMANIKDKAGDMMKKVTGDN